MKQSVPTTQDSNNDRSSGPGGGVRVKSAAQQLPHHNKSSSIEGQFNRGQSTEVSSWPQSLPKSNSEAESGDGIPYVHVRLTKDVLHAFEE